MKWKKLKSLFVVEEGAENKEEIKEQDTPVVKEQKEEEGNAIIKSNDTPKIDLNIPKNKSVSPEEGQVKKEFVNHLLKAINDNNLDGIDYLEFKNTLQSFAKMPMDESLRFQSAWTAVKTMGANEQKIIESAQYYLSILAKEEEQFKNAMKRGKSQKIDGELKRMEQLKKQRNEKLELIKKMEKEITSISKQINAISEQVMQDEVMIETKRNHFYTSYQHVVNQIKSDIDKFKQNTNTDNK